MSKETRQAVLLVPIDLHGISRATLENLVLISHRLQREMVGLLLENEQLQQIADLPFTTEVVRSSGRERGLQRAELQRQHYAVMQHTRQLLDQLAASRHVSLSYREAAGNRLHSALKLTIDADVLFPSRQRWRLTRPGWAPPRPFPRLGLLLGGTPTDQRTLAISDTLVKAGLVERIYVLSESAPNAEQLNRLAHHGTRVCVQSNLALKPSDLTALIRNNAYDLLLLPANSLGDIPPTVLDAALEETTGEVMVIR